MLIRNLDKLCSIGSILAAAACPLCFPLLAAAGSFFGLGILRRYEGKLIIIFQFLVLAALAGLIISYRRHRNPAPLIIGILSTATVFFAFHVHFNEILNYIGLAGLLAASVINHVANRRCVRCNVQERK